jgi:hypothetical protein
MSDRTQRRAEARRQAKLRRKELSKMNQAAVPTESVAESKISTAQLAANQANAKLSTGPTSQAGLDISSRNNFRHGLTQNEGALILLETESEEAYQASYKAFQKEWNPKTETEHDLVERLTNHKWLRRRSQRLAAEFQDARGIITDEKKYALYRRYETQHERAFNKALADLMRVRSLQIREQNGFESQRRKEELHVLKIKAMKEREIREKFLRLDAEAKLIYSQAKLTDAGLATFASASQTEGETTTAAGR